MNRTAGKSVKWLVSVPESVNGAVRMHLAQSGGRKGDLSKFVVEAVEGGKFHVYPIETIDQGIEILTGVEAGDRDAAGSFPGFRTGTKPALIS